MVSPYPQPPGTSFGTRTRWRPSTWRFARFPSWRSVASGNPAKTMSDRPEGARVGRPAWTGALQVCRISSRGSPSGSTTIAGDRNKDVLHLDGLRTYLLFSRNPDGAEELPICFINEEEYENCDIPSCEAVRRREIASENQRNQNCPPVEPKGFPTRSSGEDFTESFRTVTPTSHR